jgi:multimeric flavodoxin WrbA
MRKNKLLIITASQRAHGNSALAAKILAENLPKAYKSETVNISSLNIKPCIACDKCRDNLKCVFNDDAGKLIKKTEAAGIVLIASPVYFTGVPGPFKTFIDRNQVRWYKHAKMKKSGNKKKKGIIILTQGQKKPKYFRPAESEIRSFFAVNNIETKLVIKLPEMDEAGKVLNDKNIIRRLKKSGRDIFFKKVKAGK